MIRIGIIGVGNMGRNHLRLLSRMQDRVKITAIVDPVIYSGTLPVWMNNGNVRVFRDLQSVDFSMFDAAVIAAPTVAHYSLGITCLKAGKHLLIEKPLAASVIEGHQLVNEAQKRGLILQVGHVERFNPAVRMISDIVDNEEIIALEASRLSYFTPSDSYGNLVIDLMIHDIDIALSIFGNCQPERIAAHAHAKGSIRDLLHVNALLEFPGRHIAALSTSRLAHEKARTLKLYTIDKTIYLNYITREIHVSRLGNALSLNDKGLNMRGYHIETGNDYYVVDGEPLYFELDDFLDCLESGRQPTVNGEAGLRALCIAYDIIDQIEDRQVSMKEKDCQVSMAMRQ